MLPEAWVPPRVDMVDLVLEDEGEDLEEDILYEEDPSMDKEDPTVETEIMEEDSLQDSSGESYQETFLHLTLTDSFCGYG